MSIRLRSRPARDERNDTPPADVLIRRTTCVEGLKTIPTESEWASSGHARNEVRHLPVTEDEALIGVISERDVFRALVQALRDEK